jgi:hypothetical protein
MYFSNYIVFQGEKQGVGHWQNKQFLRIYFVAFTKANEVLRQRQKHFPQPMKKPNLLQKILEYQGFSASTQCAEGPDRRLPVRALRRSIRSGFTCWP